MTANRNETLRRAVTDICHPRENGPTIKPFTHAFEN